MLYLKMFRASKEGVEIEKVEGAKGEERGKSNKFKVKP